MINYIRKFAHTLFFLATTHLILFCQIKDIGLLNIKNYSKTLYMAGSQTWDATQNKQGILYFANNEGIL
jgi:hypothetical protein